ncbi:hypothetical protein N657DRAFT_673027 [Parathielavia appendiculata]|uniref:Uncharacterized protein n=1 Tax=Parathielavia appendiculata TaxID=2587402 RepID=A0AAN6TXD1_9PEZI|nr:hypothetical protein N657DRAFT_673027 [Parathielavia appendiculata]
MLDRRLHAFEQSRCRHEGSDPTAAQTSDDALVFFLMNHKEDATIAPKVENDGETDMLVGIIVQSGDPLSLLAQISSTCLNLAHNCSRGTTTLREASSYSTSSALSTLGRLEQLMDRNRTNLAKLRHVTQVDFGDYPVCSWSSRPVKGMEYHGRSAEPVILDPEGFSLHSGHEVELLEGFMLETRKWALFDIANLHPYRDKLEDADAFHSIYLDKTLFASLKSDFEAYFAKRRGILNMLSN